MKKIFAILMTICLLASALCISAFAADTVLRISAQNKDGELVVIGDYDNFQDGWNDAMEIAGSSGKMEKNGYERIVVDLYDDWSANKDGEFTEEIRNGDGFDNDTIYIPEDAKVTLNMNGHTIDRHLTEDENDGEVMFINDDADVIINDGTIKGGYSNSEGGGLYIESGANVTLNNVNIVGNAVENDDGAAIYMYGGATLTMNGGSISDNFVDENNPYGTICVNESTLVMNNVTIDGNYTYAPYARGLVIYAIESTVKMDECTVSNNATKESVAGDIIYAQNSDLTITNTDFINNNTLDIPDEESDVTPRLLYIDNTPLNMTGGKMTKNGSIDLFYFINSEADIIDVTITENAASVMCVNNGTQTINMTECTLDKNVPRYYKWDVEIKKKGELSMTDCFVGDTSFSNRTYVNVAYSTVPEEEAVIGISGILADGTTAFTDYYKNFAYGWNLAMDQAVSNDYDRVAIDLYDDLVAEDGLFNNSLTGGLGFDSDTLYIPANANITLNMNGHTIDRALTKTQENGNVLCIGENADVIINYGTITGGFSSNSAGGIHINGGANVTLNDVNINGNGVEVCDGAGIAVLGGATLTMNGGSFTENRTTASGTLYVNGSTAVLDNVLIRDTRAISSATRGAAIYGDNSTVTVINCVVTGNGVFGRKSVAADSIIAGYNSTFIIENTDFSDNSWSSYPSGTGTQLFYFKNSSLTFKDGKITGNYAGELLHFDNSDAEIQGVTLTDNTSHVIYVKNSSQKVTMTDCTLGNNEPNGGQTIEVQVKTKGSLEMIDCILGDTVFGNEDMVTISNNALGSIFGEGSLTMIVVLLAIIVFGVAIFLIVYHKKKKADPVVADNKETDDEE